MRFSFSFPRSRAVASYLDIPSFTPKIIPSETCEHVALWALGPFVRGDQHRVCNASGFVDALAPLEAFPEKGSGVCFVGRDVADEFSQVLFAET